MDETQKQQRPKDADWAVRQMKSKKETFYQVNILRYVLREATRPETWRQANDMAKEAEENFCRRRRHRCPDQTRPDGGINLCCHIFVLPCASGSLAFLFNFCAYKLVSIAAQ